MFRDVIHDLAREKYLDKTTDAVSNQLHYLSGHISTAAGAALEAAADAVWCVLVGDGGGCGEQGH